MSMSFKRIKDWATSITTFRTGDVIPVDGPDGTAKMSKDDLLRVTAENALADGEMTEISDEEFYFVITDVDGKFFAGIKKDGSIEWAVGIPTPLREALEGVSIALSQKVDKVEGKSLIDSDFGNNVLDFDTPEYIFVITDNLERLVFAIDKDYNVLVPSISNLAKDKGLVNKFFAERVVEADGRGYSERNVDASEQKDIGGYDENGGFRAVKVDTKNLRVEGFSFAHDIGVVNVAPYNASVEDKLCADIVLKGKNDEDALQAILDNHKNGCTINIAAGDVIIDGFHRNENYGKSAIAFRGSSRSTYRLVGKGVVGMMNGKCTRLLVSASAFTDLTYNEKIKVIDFKFDPTASENYRGEIENITILSPTRKYALTFIDFAYASVMNLHNIYIGFSETEDEGTTNPNESREVPNEKLYGCRGIHGSNNGIGCRINQCEVFGCYEGFRMGGEHIIMTCCLARNCVYGYTFGKELLVGANAHPITLINCADESNARMPYFGPNSNTNPHVGAGQAISFIDFNLEKDLRTRSPLISRELMEEEVPGAFYGDITYTLQSCDFSDNSTQNVVDEPMWKNGSGLRFRTHNQAHKQIVTTSERESYAGNIGEAVYDSDLSKMAYCIGQGKRPYGVFNIGNVATGGNVKFAIGSDSFTITASNDNPKQSIVDAVNKRTYASYDADNDFLTIYSTKIEEVDDADIYVDTTLTITRSSYFVGEKSEWVDANGNNI